MTQVALSERDLEEILEGLAAREGGLDGDARKYVASLSEHLESHLATIKNDDDDSDIERDFNSGIPGSFSELEYEE